MGIALHSMTWIRIASRVNPNNTNCTIMNHNETDCITMKTNETNCTTLSHTGIDCAAMKLTTDLHHTESKLLLKWIAPRSHALEMKCPSNSTHGRRTSVLLLTRRELLLCVSCFCISHLTSQGIAAAHLISTHITQKLQSARPSWNAQ